MVVAVAVAAAPLVNQDGTIWRRIVPPPKPYFWLNSCCCQSIADPYLARQQSNLPPPMSRSLCHLFRARCLELSLCLQGGVIVALFTGVFLLGKQTIKYQFDCMFIN
ncbi:MAG: hypothetical protein ABJH63_20655 [Rhizobiaceae bacterium]